MLFSVFIKRTQEPDLSLSAGGDAEGASCWKLSALHTPCSWKSMKLNLGSAASCLPQAASHNVYIQFSTHDLDLSSRALVSLFLRGNLEEGC